MLKIYDALKAVLFTAFATFTFVCYTFFMLALSSSAANLGPTSTLLNLTLFYSLVQGVFTLIHRLKFASAVRRMLHLALSLAAFLIIYVGIGSYTAGAPKVLAMAGAFLVCYCVIAIAISIIRALVERYKNKTLEYDLFVKEKEE